MSSARGAQIVVGGMRREKQAEDLFPIPSLCKVAEQRGRAENSPLPSGLPSWMQLAKNREPMLRATDRLRSATV